MFLQILLIALIIPLIIIIISSLPLYFSVNLLGKNTSLLRVIMVNMIVPIIIFIIKIMFDSWTGAISFLAIIIVYHYLFKISWAKAIMAWALQFMIAIIMIIIILFLSPLIIL